MKEKEDLSIYQEYLCSIINARLFFNTIEEYEDKLDNHSLHNNGVRRCLDTPQKIRSAYRDFKVEAIKLTRGQIDLDNLMEDYKIAWDFYRKYFSRRRNPIDLAKELLRYIYPPYSQENLNDAKKDIFEDIVNQKINVTLLLLMILKALPGYESKEGNVFNISRIYRNVLDFLEDYTKDNQLFNTIPAIKKADEENHKSRLTLIYHTEVILDVYYSYYTSKDCYDQSLLMKQSVVNLDLDGFWNNSNDEGKTTSFWQIERALNDGTYFVTSWHKNSDNVLCGIRFTVLLIETTDHKLMAYVMHPQAIKHRIEGKPYTDEDHAWFESPMPKIDNPDNLMFERVMDSNVWCTSINITRVTNDALIETYDKWFDSYKTFMKYEQYNYHLKPSLYAITQNHLYIQIGKSSRYYQIPSDVYDGLKNVKLNDLVGIMTMNDKEYIVFDELLLYIEINDEELERYNIKIVDSIV